MSTIGQQILALLEQRNIVFQHLRHQPASNCEQSAAQRGLPMAIGGKSLLFRTKPSSSSRHQADFAMIVLPADQQVDSSKVRRHLGSQKLRFASGDELMALAGVEKGALPPFGNGLLPIPMYLDLQLESNEQIAFNCGVTTESVILAMNDYLGLVEAKWGDFIKAP